MPKVTQLLSGQAEIRVEAVWLKSLNTKLPVCAFRRLLGPDVLDNPFHF